MKKIFWLPLVVLMALVLPPLTTAQSFKEGLWEITGNTFHWKVECRDREGVMTVVGRITYRGNTFEGDQEVRENGESITKAKFSGRWIGPCK
ncbi:MAG: hypothetical protein N3G78_01620 [Desulfobacterota bacterium]|nr:hypothetical protein [Thermodesulfobacteriota bacterium]